MIYEMQPSVGSHGVALLKNLMSMVQLIDKEIERITNRIQNQFNDFVIEDAQSNGQKPLEEELLRIVRLFQ